MSEWPPVAMLMIAPPGVPRSFEQFREETIKAVEGVAEQFEDPEDDWDPMLLLQRPDGSIAVASLALYMSSDELKYALGTQVMPWLVRETEAVQVGFVVSVWMAKPPAGTTYAEAQQIKASEYASRVEQVNVLLADGEHWEVMMARIKRWTDAPPTLLPWKKPLKSDGKVMMEGPMFDGLIEALREVNE